MRNNWIVCLLILTASSVFAYYRPPMNNIRTVIPLDDYKSMVFYSLTNGGVQPNIAAERVERIKEIDFSSKLISENTVQLSASRVILADYDLLRDDFEDLRSMGNPDVDKWLLEQVGFIAEEQVLKGYKNKVNEEIPVGAKKRKAYRPYNYGRALVYEVNGGLLDVKGAGSRDPRNQEGGHSNGLMTLAECLREFLFENLIHRVLTHAKRENIVIDELKVDGITVGSYACIDTGFELASGEPAGLYVRQAHTRWNPAAPIVLGAPEFMYEVSGSGHLRPQYKSFIAKVLSQYNIWADEEEHKGRQRYDSADIQGTRENVLFDFGAFLVDKKPRDKYPNARNTEKAKAIDFSIWGFKGKRDPLFDNPMLYSQDTVNSMKTAPNINAFRDWIWSHYRNFILPVDRALN